MNKRCISLQASRRLTPCRSLILGTGCSPCLIRILVSIWTKRHSKNWSKPKTNQARTLRTEQSKWFLKMRSIIILRSDTNSTRGKAFLKTRTDCLRSHQRRTLRKPMEGLVAREGWNWAVLCTGRRLWIQSRRIEMNHRCMIISSIFMLHPKWASTSMVKLGACIQIKRSEPPRLLADWSLCWAIRTASRVGTCSMLLKSTLRTMIRPRHYSS